MQERVVLEVRETRPPAWAMVAPLLYLAACALCVRAAMMDRTLDVGVSGILVAVGLAPAFALPAVFSTRRARLEVTSDGLLVDGRSTKVDDVRVVRADRGSARLHIETRAGDTRTFVVASYADAQRLAMLLPPVSAPAGALAA